MAAERKKSFYSISDYSSGLSNGKSITVSRIMSYHGESASFKQFLSIPLKELEGQLKASMAEEKKIYDELQKAVGAWEQHGAQSLLLQKAIKYLKVPEVKHTANEWKQGKDGVWEISNLVYKMTFSTVRFRDEWKLDWDLSYTAPGLAMRYTIQEETSGKKKGQWCATWGIAVNRPRRPKSEKHFFAGDIMVVEQKKKYYNAEADARHYIQGRFDVYAHLFTELSPPIPNQYKRHFCINGILLPGYTVAPPEQPSQEVASELLALLDDSDVSPSPCAVPEPPDPKPAQKSKGGPPKSKAAPVR